MAQRTAIDIFYEDASSVVGLLQAQAQISLQVVAGDHFRKALLLAVASHFEERVCQIVLEFVRQKAPGSSLIENFIKNKAIARQYHSWFDWEKPNANKFFAFFGSDFRQSMSSKVTASPLMQSSIRAFLELGNERNKLVHQNYVVFPMEKTMEEIYQLYKDALPFVDGLLKELLESEVAA